MSNPPSGLRRTILVRTIGLSALTLALALAAGCGSDSTEETSSAPTTPSLISSAPSSPSASSATPAPAPPQEASAASIQSTVDDVAEYAVAMEQFFFGNGYPEDLDGALATAKRLTNLSLSPGNTIATYLYDPATREFQLCVENPSGASATYDTEPMSTVQTTSTGGCPRP